MAYSPRRVHVGPRDFDNAAATDYSINFTAVANQVAAASATNPHGLSGWGFTTTSLGATAGTAGDFNASGDQTPSHVLLDTAADAFVTPRIFGGYDQFQRVSDILGYIPTKLRLDVYASWPTNANQEATSFFGFCAPAVTDISAAGGGAGINSKVGAVGPFVLTSDTGSDDGPALDTAWHRWRIEVGSSTTEWFTDVATPGTLASHGTITTETDIWPLSFKAIVNLNDIALSWLRISYV